jgi:hypothetical protein
MKKLTYAELEAKYDNYIDMYPEEQSWGFRHWLANAIYEGDVTVIEGDIN